MSTALVSCDPEGSSSSGAPPPYKLTQDKGGTTLTIDEGVTTIKAGEYAAVASIGSGAGKKTFKTKITRQTLGLKTDGEVRTAVTAIILPSTLETIEEYAFYGHSAVKGTLIIPDKVQSIGAHAFGGTGTDLTVDIKDDSKLENTVGAAAAFDIANIKTIQAPRYSLTSNADNATYTLAVAEGVTTVEKGEFSSIGSVGGTGGTPKTTLNTRLKGALLGAEPHNVITAITLPSTLEVIEDYAFYSYARVQGTLTIPKRVQRVGKNAFQYLGAANASSIVLAFEKDSQCTIIKSEAFEQSKITSFALPEQLETIEFAAFANFNRTTEKMSSFTIPEKVRNIENAAFLNMNISNSATLTIKSPHLTTPDPLLFVLRPTDTVFTTVKLPKVVYDRFTTQAQLASRFGQVTAYQHLNGTAHAAKP